MKTVAPAYHCDLEEFERIQPGQWSPPRSCSLQRHILLFWIINFGCGTIFLLAWRQVAWNDAWRKIERSSRDLNAEWVCLKKPARVLYRMLRMRPRCALQVLEWTLVRKLHGVTTIYIYIYTMFSIGLSCSKSVKILSFFTQLHRATTSLVLANISKKKWGECCNQILQLSALGDNHVVVFHRNKSVTSC